MTPLSPPGRLRASERPLALATPYTVNGLGSFSLSSFQFDSLKRKQENSRFFGHKKRTFIHIRLGERMHAYFVEDVTLFSTSESRKLWPYMEINLVHISPPAVNS